MKKPKQFTKKDCPFVLVFTVKKETRFIGAKNLDVLIGLVATMGKAQKFRAFTWEDAKKHKFLDQVEAICLGAK